MKKFIVLTFLCVFNLIGFSQEKNKRLIDKQVALESNITFAGCGYFHFIIAFKFKIINTDSFIIAFIDCPDFYGKNFFVKGNRYSMDATNDMSEKLRNGTLINPYKNKKLPTYFITRIVKESN